MRSRALVQLNPQLSPQPARRGVGRLGLGDITTTAEYQAGWNQIQAQLQTEGNGPGSAVVGGAQLIYSNSVSQMVEALGATQTGAAIQAATGYVLNTSTIGGAVDMVSGLIQASQTGETVPQLAQTFTGAMVGLLALAGASAGLGVAIAGGISVVVGIMQNFGLFPGGSSGVSICPGVTTPTQPDYMVPCPAPYGASQPNCVGAWDPYWTPPTSGIQPGSGNWRKFPNPPSGGSILDPFGADAIWFTNYVLPTSVNQIASGNFSTQIHWQPPNNDKPILYVTGEYPGIRYIDIFFPQYHHMECEMAGINPLLAELAVATGNGVEVVGALSGFEQAFFQALKLNWEYALNGIKLQATDSQVLVHTIYQWNQAHEPGVGFDIQPSTATPWSANGTACDGSAPPWYAAILAPTAKNQAPSGLVGVINPATGLLHINTGPKYPYTLGGGLFGIGGRKSASSASSTSAVGSVAMGVAAVAGVSLLGTAIYAHIKREPYKQVWRSIWKGTGGRLVK
jgi:hypothetical protein